jgi:hypothetical protein
MFAALQRGFATVLTLNTNAEIKDRFQEYTLRFQEAERSAVKIVGLDYIKNPETKHKMFTLIGDESLLKGAAAFKARARGLVSGSMPAIPELPAAMPKLPGAFPDALPLADISLDDATPSKIKIKTGTSLDRPMDEDIPSGGEVDL